jgi:hypothetical protein
MLRTIIPIICVISTTDAFVGASLLGHVSTMTDSAGFANRQLPSGRDTGSIRGLQDQRLQSTLRESPDDATLYVWFGRALVRPGR